MGKLGGSLFVALALLGSSSASASTWNVFKYAYNDDTVYYFDADTVVKSGDTITLWTKYVRLRTAEKDGSWTTAQRAVYACQKRTFQSSSMSIYDKSGTFMRSFTSTTVPTDIAPDSLGEAILKAACSPNFPRATDQSQYWPVPDNDVLEHARAFQAYSETLTDKAPK